MADLVLEGVLNLEGLLTLEGSSGGKVKVGSNEVLVEVLPSGPPQCSSAPPVLLPPPPASPAQPQPTVWIVNSFNKTVKAGTQAIVAQGMAMQGLTGGPMWPGMVLPSTGNPTVTINNIPINVVNDKAAIFPSGGMATFNSSGQT
ncbi:hypothetical protein [Pyxidicoccus sp. MSG2]|uniref:hypothetical protein n=1 Tax=Pyxidicoccus sp. MSG2 TaxID=2996790 RepID=UPI0022720C7C|nr:hypothetical protein [Pyxidicoccus sp. MSG2]MCY1022310.1 hypothetical protein [Pyxidicoccus sp. MSG2]